MSLTISCPACKRTLRVPESLLGQAVKCPGCARNFTAPENAEEDAPRPSTSVSEKPSRRPAPQPQDDEDDDAPRRRERYSDSRRSQRSRDEDDDDDEGRGPSPRDVKAGWDKVRMGINLVMIGIWVWLGSSILAVLGGLLGVLLVGGTLMSSTNRPNFTSLGFAGILIILSVCLYYLGVFAELVLRLIGYGLCMAAPARREGGMKPLAITAFILAVVYVLFSLLNVAVSGFSGFAAPFNNRSGVDAAGAGVGLLGGLCALASFVVYLFFLRSACTTIRARELTSKPIAVLIAFVCFWVLAILLLVVMICAGVGAVGSAFQAQSAGSAANSMGTWFILSIVVGCMVGLVYAGLQVWYILVLQKIRDAVASYRRRM